jgi:DNA end-binding protein Ku
MPAGALLAGVVEQPLRHVLPDRVAAIQSDCIGGLDFDGPLATPASDAKHVTLNFRKTPLPHPSPSRARASVFKDRFPVFGREGRIWSSGKEASPTGGFDGQFFHLLRGRHTPARGSVGHSELEHKENGSRVRSSPLREKIILSKTSRMSEPSRAIRLESDISIGVPAAMAPRANWKGFLRLSLVTCPVALYPATSESEKVSFNQLNRKTGHRIKYAKVDADTGEEVANEDIVKGYKVDTDTFIEVTKEELENVALESTRTIDIDEFVDRSEIDPRYLIRPYYLRPDGKVGHDAFAVIRETIREMNKVAIGRVVLTSREHIIALEPLDKGLMGTLLRYPYEVRSEEEYFDDIQDVKVTKDMLDLARHIVNQKAGRFEPDKFEDQYETALVDLINAKRAGKPIGTKERPRGENVVDLMDALRKSIGAAEPAKDSKPAKKPRKVGSGQKEMLMPIAGNKPAKEAAAKKPAARPQRKSA